jgi:hypothetical protein
VARCADAFAGDRARHQVGVLLVDASGEKVSARVVTTVHVTVAGLLRETAAPRLAWRVTA